MYIRDAERLVRQMHRQKTPLDYIRHYLMETYQMGDEFIDQVFENVGLMGQDDMDGNPMAMSRAKKKQDDGKKARFNNYFK